MTHAGDDWKIDWNVVPLARTDDLPRYFIGVSAARPGCIQGALIRTLGHGLAVRIETVGTADVHDQRFVDVFRQAPRAFTSRAANAADLAETVHQVVSTLGSRLNPEQGSVLAIALHEFGVWHEDPLLGRLYEPQCDTAMAAKLSGLTVIDDLPGRDLANRGRGGPCQAAGIWLLTADPGSVPGKRIRAVLDIDQTVRLLVVPPRQRMQLPAQLITQQLLPGTAWIEQLAREFGTETFDIANCGKLAVQGRKLPGLIDIWHEHLAMPIEAWSPGGIPGDELTDALRSYLNQHSASKHDVLCSAFHLTVDRIAQYIKHQLPRSHPVGQLIVAGAGHQNGFLLGLLQQRLPEVELLSIETLGIPPNFLNAAATAVMAQLHVDQIAGNSPALTGTDVPRVLGRITPGNPANWHEVLAEMARTLPEKLPLRSAV